MWYRASGRPGRSRSIFDKKKDRPEGRSREAGDRGRLLSGRHQRSVVGQFHDPHRTHLFVDPDSALGLELRDFAFVDAADSVPRFGGIAAPELLAACVSCSMTKKALLTYFSSI